MSAENPWEKVYQNAGLAPSFGQHKLNSANLQAFEAQHAPGPGARTVRIQDGGQTGTPMSMSMLTQRMDDTSRASFGSVYEYLTTREPRTARHSQFSGSRLGTCGDTGDGTLSKQDVIDGGKVTASTIMYQKTSDEMGKFTKKKQQMTLEEAQEYLKNSKRSPLKPPLTHWEQDNVRQQIIQSLADETPDEEAPGGSWVLRPGTIPASRAMMKNPDKTVPMLILTPDKRRMLCDLRLLLYAQNIFDREELLGFFNKYDQDRSKHIPMNLFFELVKNFGFELTTARVLMLEQMFQSWTRKDDMDYEAFASIMMEATKGVPKPRTFDTDGRILRERNRASAIFDGLDSLRPKSQSGRFHTFTDIKNQLERPLVIQAGNQTLRGMYQFMSERETVILHNYRDRDPLRETYKPQNHSFDPEPVELPGRSLPKRVPTPQNIKMSDSSEAEAAAENTAANAVVDAYLKGAARDVFTPSKARGRNVDFMLVPASPDAGEQTDTYIRAASTPNKTPREAPNKIPAELRSPTDVVDAATYFDYQVIVSPPQTGSKGGNRENPAQGIQTNPKPAGKSSSKHGAKKGGGALLELRPPSWEVASRYQARPVEMLKKLSHIDFEGMNQPAMWGSTNGCNQDIPGGAEARAELKETLAFNQKLNANKRVTNWSYAHSGNELDPVDWTSTTRQQMLQMPRLRTPKKQLSLVQELREPPWSVAERHQVHLMKYDHRLVGLRRPEPLAKHAP